MTRLCTNLPRTPFWRPRGPPLSLPVADRLCFKEWKSYANLHQVDTANAHIAEVCRHRSADRASARIRG